MRKIVLVMAIFLVIYSSIGLAAPINDLAPGQTALGTGSDTFYLEHKFNDRFILGFQNVNRDTSNMMENRGNMDDFYGQFQNNSHVRTIIGVRNIDSSSKMYVGVAVSKPISPDGDGYASLIGGSAFKELQAGANFKLTHNVDLNLNYHIWMPDEGGNQNGVGIGATFKF